MKYIIKKTTQQEAKNKTEILTTSRDIFIENLKEYYNKENTQSNNQHRPPQTDKTGKRNFNKMKGEHKEENSQTD